MYEYSKRKNISQSLAKDQARNTKGSIANSRTIQRTPISRPTRYFPGRRVDNVSSEEEEEEEGEDDDDEEKEESVTEHSDEKQDSGHHQQEIPEKLNDPETKIKRTIEVKVKPFKKVEQPIKQIYEQPKPIEPIKQSSDEEKEEEEEEEEESSEEEDSEESSSDDEPAFIPTFISKENRGKSSTIKTASSLSTSSMTNKSESSKSTENHEQDKYTKTTEEADLKKEERKQRVLELAEETIQREIENEKALKFEFRDDNEIFQVDDTDDLDPEAEHAAWRVRELKREQRERQEIEELEKEQEERELQKDSQTNAVSKGSRLDDFDKTKSTINYINEHGQDESKNNTRVKEHWKIRKDDKETNDTLPEKHMQRFYHKGAFYQDMDVLKNRDFQAAVEDDYSNKQILPEYLQTRGQSVGLKGRTKYKSLKEEDTTRGSESLWYKRHRNESRDDRNVSK